MWRRAWRDKVSGESKVEEGESPSSEDCPGTQILPAVYNFKPDIIIVSAGFDAHK